LKHTPELLAPSFRDAKGKGTRRAYTFRDGRGPGGEPGAPEAAEPSSEDVRTTNLCERSFVEERRRSKVIPHFFDERSCLKLVFASLWRASQRWRGVRFTEMERKQLQAYIRVRQAMGKKVRDLQAA